jgi:hypothetical protein
MVAAGGWRLAKDAGEVISLEVAGGRTWIRITDLFLIREALCLTEMSVRRASPPMLKPRVAADRWPTRRLVKIHHGRVWAGIESAQEAGPCSTVATSAVLMRTAE